MTVDLTPDLLGPWGDLRVRRPLEGGHRNRAWLCEGAGALWVAKTTHHDAPALDWLDAVHDAATRAGLNPPRLRRTSGGTISANGLTLEPFIEGRPASPIDMALLLPRIAAFHTATRDIPARPGVPPTEAGALSLPEDLPGDARAFCLSALAAMPEAPRTAVHGDLTPANVIMSPAGPVLLDWDEARRDHPGLDLSALSGRRDGILDRTRLAREILTGWSPEPAYARALVADLRADGTLANVF